MPHSKLIPTQAHIQLVVDMLVMQSEINDLIDIDWRRADNPYLDAVMVEAIECKGHLENWKWWKSSKPLSADSLWQARLELVDIAHFIWCEVLKSHMLPSGAYTVSMEEMAKSVLPKYEAEFSLDELTLVAAQEKASAAEMKSLWKEVHVTIRYLTKEASSENLKGVLPHFYRMMHYLDMSLEDLYGFYMPKNALNILRQHYNYQGNREGMAPYAKNWPKVVMTEDGAFEKVYENGQLVLVEDNEVLAYLVDVLRADAERKGTLLTKATLYAALEACYPR